MGKVLMALPIFSMTSYIYPRFRFISSKWHGYPIWPQVTLSNERVKIPIRFASYPSSQYPSGQVPKHLKIYKPLKFSGIYTGHW